MSNIFEIQEVQDRMNRCGNKLLRGRHEFDTIQKRVFYLVLDQLNPKLEISKDLITGNKVVRIYNAKKVLGCNYSNLKKSVLDLQTKAIRFIDDDKEVFESIVPFPSVSYADGTLELIVFEKMLPHMYELKEAGFTQYQLRSAMSLSGPNSQRMYELLSGWKDVGVKEYDLDLLKMQLNLDANKAYESYAVFNHSVLKRTQKELAEKTDISFTYEPIKRGRKTHSVRFFIKSKDNQKHVDSISDSDDKTARALHYLDQLGITRDNLRSQILARQPEFWKWLNHYKMNASSIKNPAGHLITTLGLN